MQLQLFSVRDNKVGSYNTVFVSDCAISASRIFATAANDPDTTINKFAQDFDLTLLGSYDTVTGVITPEPYPKFVVAALSLKAKTSEHGAPVASTPLGAPEHLGSSAPPREGLAGNIAGGFVSPAEGDSQAK